MAGRQAICISAPAKVNLFLELLAKRPDGFHELETLMASVDVCDELVIGRPLESFNETITLDARWADGFVANQNSVFAASFGVLPPPEKNLVFRALELLRAECGVTEGAAVTLTKQIPAEAGLGGASSDAAAALLAGNQFWGLGLSIARLAEIGAKLGSDVPFFLHGGYAVCRGRGEIIEPVQDLPPIWVVILRPAFGLSTPKVYARCQVPTTPRSLDGLFLGLRNRDEMALAGQLVNRLWTPATEIEPRLGELPGLFDGAGLAAHQMSGSGSSYFGVTFDRAKAIRAAAILRNRSAGFVGLARGGIKNACIAACDTLSS